MARKRKKNKSDDSVPNKAPQPEKQKQKQKPNEIGLVGNKIVDGKKFYEHRLQYEHEKRPYSEDGRLKQNPFSIYSKFQYESLLGNVVPKDVKKNKSLIRRKLNGVVKDIELLCEASFDKIDTRQSKQDSLTIPECLQKLHAITGEFVKRQEFIDYAKKYMTKPQSESNDSEEIASV